MTMVTLRPNGYSQDLGRTGTLADVNDGNDSTYMAFTSGGHITFGFPALTLPAGAQIRTVRVKYRTQTQAAASALVNSRIYVVYAYRQLAYGYYANGAIRTFMSPIMAGQPNGQPWTLTTINQIRVALYLNPSLRLMDVRLEVVYNERPTVTVTAPTGTVSTTTMPTVAWTYVDAESDAQQVYDVRIFGSAQYGASGFNPDTTPPYWRSGSVHSPATGLVVPANLPNDNYRAYVRVSDQGSNGRASTWEYTGWAQSVILPDTPSLSVIGELDTSVTLTVGGLTAGNGVVVERSDDLGVTWGPVRGAYTWTATAGTFVGHDYEAPLNVQTRYRAWTWNEPAGYLIASLYSTVRTVLVSNNDLRIKDTANPGYQLRIRTRDWQVTSPRKEGIFDALGSKSAVVLVDATPGGDRIALSLYFKDDPTYRAFMVLRATGHVLQLCTDTPGEQWYVMLTDAPQVTTQASSQRLNTPYRTLDMTAVAVTRPADPLPAPGS